MRKTKRAAAWILGLAMLLSLSAASAEIELPVIPAFQGTLNVRPIHTEEEAVEYAREIWALDYLGMDFQIDYYRAELYEEDCWVVYAKDGPDDGDYCYGDVMFDLAGNVIGVENASSGIFEVINEIETGETDETLEADDPYDSDAWAEWRDMLDRRVEYPFLKEVCPGLYEEYTRIYPPEEGGMNEFLGRYYRTYTDSYNNTNVFDLYYSSSYQDETWCIRIGVQISPVIRIVDFDVYADAEEGGNG